MKLMGYDKASVIKFLVVALELSLLWLKDTFVGTYVHLWTSPELGPQAVFSDTNITLCIIN
jgi:hypothetical protein